jgi:hypothetical protein
MNYRNLAFWVMILFIFALGIYLVWFINSESYECLSSPLVYGVSLYEDTQGEFTCTCSSPNSKPILVTKDGMSLQESYNNWLLPSDK